MGGAIVERRAVAAARVVTKEVVKRFAVRSTKASAQLENRAVPAGYVRSAELERFLAERRPQT